MATPVTYEAVQLLSVAAATKKLARKALRLKKGEVTAVQEEACTVLATALLSTMYDEPEDDNYGYWFNLLQKVH